MADQQTDSPIPQRLKYADRLYVARKGEGGIDGPVEGIAAWIQQRLQSGGPPVCTLEAPPGFGKTWCLQRFVESYRSDFASRLVIVGPVTPPAEYTEVWWKTLLDAYVLHEAYQIDANALHQPENGAFQDLVAGLVESLEQMGRHLLFILDDIDRSTELPELEEKLLAVFDSLCLNHQVSLLLAWRNDFGLRQTELLRRRSQVERIVILAFNADQAQEQIKLLLDHYAIEEAERDRVASILGELQNPYTWGIPALNSQLVESACQKLQAEERQWHPLDIEDCILRALRLNLDADRPFLQQAFQFSRKYCPEGWQIPDIQEKLQLREQDADVFRNRLYALTLIDKPPNRSINTYQVQFHWNSIFEVWHELNKEHSDSN